MNSWTRTLSDTLRIFLLEQLVKHELNHTFFSGSTATSVWRFCAFSVMARRDETTFFI